MFDHRYHLALVKVFPILNQVPNYLNIWMNGNYSIDYWKPILEAWQTKIDDLRQWTKSLGWLDRRAYNGWLDFYQNNLNSAWSELRTQKEKKHMAKYQLNRLKEEERKRKFLDNGKFPEPPEELR